MTITREAKIRWYDNCAREGVVRVDGVSIAFSRFLEEVIRGEEPLEFQREQEVTVELACYFDEEREVLVVEGVKSIRPKAG